MYIDGLCISLNTSMANKNGYGISVDMCSGSFDIVLTRYFHFSKVFLY